MSTSTYSCLFRYVKYKKDNICRKLNNGYAFKNYYFISCDFREKTILLFINKYIIESILMRYK
jgi:hypothetical protein